MPPEQPFYTHESPTSEYHDVLAAQRENEARALCQIGNHNAILQLFREPENRTLLDEQINRVRVDPFVQEKLTAIIPDLSPAHWEMLTLLELFDIETFRHCIRTYQIVKQKLDSPNPVGTFLRTELEKESIPPTTLAIAALLHDIGKIGIPLKELTLNNSLTDREWHQLCIKHFCEQDQCDTTQAETTIHEKLTSGAAHNLREKDLIPFSRCLTLEQRGLLSQSGIDPEQTLGKIMNVHQDFSGAITKAYGLDDTFITLVSNHHERPLDTPEPYPISQSALRIAAILRFADVFDAIHSTRAYKKGNPFLTTIAILIQKTHDGFIDPRLTHLWINEDMEIFTASQEEYFRILPEAIDREHTDEVGYSEQTRNSILEKEHAALRTILQFLKEDRV